MPLDPSLESAANPPRAPESPTGAPSEARPRPSLIVEPETEDHPVVIPNARPPRVLLVEDDPTDREAIERALRKTGKSIDLRSVQDGQEALEFLLRSGRFDGRWAGWHPDILLLDLGLPRVSGIDVLQTIRLDSRLDDLICLVLTGSDEPETIRNLYRLGANSFLVKPASTDGFAKLAERLFGFWLDSDSLKLPR